MWSKHLLNSITIFTYHISSHKTLPGRKSPILIIPERSWTVTFGFMYYDLWMEKIKEIKWKNDAHESRLLHFIAQLTSFLTDIMVPWFLHLSERSHCSSLASDQDWRPLLTSMNLFESLRYWSLHSNKFICSNFTCQIRPKVRIVLGYFRSQLHQYTMSESQYDWRKIEQVTMKANFIHSRFRLYLYATMQWLKIFSKRQNSRYNAQ